MTTSLTSYSSPKPSGGFELWSWLFMRLSGLLLLGLALGHLVIMHLINNVDAIDYAFVAGRYAGWFWRGYDLLVLVLAMCHGLNGVRILIDDYVPACAAPGAAGRHPLLCRRRAVVLLYFIGGAFLVIGIAAIVLFQPVASAGTLPVPVKEPPSWRLRNA